MKFLYIGIAALGLAIAVLVVQKGNKEIVYNKLTPEEEKVIVHKGTEPPFTGKYNSHKAAGTYTCRRCNAPARSEETRESVASRGVRVTVLLDNAGLRGDLATG